MIFSIFKSSTFLTAEHCHFTSYSLLTVMNKMFMPWSAWDPTCPKWREWAMSQSSATAHLSLCVLGGGAGDPSLLRLQCSRRRDKNYHISPALSPSPQGRRVPLPNAEFGDKELGRHNSSPSSFPLPLGFACLLWELFILFSMPSAEQGKTQLPHPPALPTPPHYTGVRAEVWRVNFILRLDSRKTAVATQLHHIHHNGDIFISDLPYSFAYFNCRHWERKTPTIYSPSHTSNINRLILSH